MKQNIIYISRQNVKAKSNTMRHNVLYLRCYLLSHTSYGLWNYVWFG